MVKVSKGGLSQSYLEIPRPGSWMLPMQSMQNYRAFPNDSTNTPNLVLNPVTAAYRIAAQCRTNGYELKIICNTFSQPNQTIYSCLEGGRAEVKASHHLVSDMLQPRWFEITLFPNSWMKKNRRGSRNAVAFITH